MTIQEYAHELHTRVSEERGAGNESELIVTSKALTSLQAAFADLKIFVHRYKFASKEEEIVFFKEIKPVFVSQIQYHTIIFKMQLHRSYTGDHDPVFYETYARKFGRFALRNMEFFQYCMSGRTDHDRLYFSRDSGMVRDIDRDEVFTTGYDNILGKFLAHQLVRDYMHRYLVAGKQAVDTADAQAPPLTWTDSKAAATELVYALYTAGVFNHGKATVKEIARGIGKLSGLDLSAYTRIFAEIRARKNGRKNLLTRMDQSLLKYIRTLD